eukprot:GHUV01033703.1.p1 GENE.GHUV01033703.1~~GHUV01033703.1.p1  ORF type:complete len:600 (+),score=213.73 GHUV01033703.1:750-2549(+)
MVLQSYYLAGNAWHTMLSPMTSVLAQKRTVQGYCDTIVCVIMLPALFAGKGVSSSAALEVAVMSATAAAHGVRLTERELALLCQKAENLVVGAPCGVMDQMTAALGDAGQLLPLLCQPAEVQGGVPIPPQVRFWGIDSGIRHHVGGSDYKSVRVGTFMGLKIISEAAHKLQFSGRSSLDRAASATRSTSSAAVLTAAATPVHISQAADSRQGSRSGGAAAAVRDTPTHGDQQRNAVAAVQQQYAHQQQMGTVSVLESPVASAAGSGGQAITYPALGDSASGTTEHYRLKCAFGGYLANISPSQYQDAFESQVPSHLTGSEFLELYGPHLDSVTSIDPSVQYAVREPTAHPIHENFRVNSFRALLTAADVLCDAATAAVAEDSKCGLGATEANSEDGSTRPAALSTAGAATGLGSLTAAAVAAADAATAMEQLALQHAAAEGLSSTSQQHTAAGRGSHRTPFSSNASQQQREQIHGPAQPPAALLGPLETLGELMFQSHASYSACGLGSGGTNRLVNIVRKHMLAARGAGKAPALYGAKITGGGCGGTVCVLGLAGSAGQAAVDDVVKQYQQETGYTPFVFGGSSIGAARFGHLRLLRWK